MPSRLLCTTLASALALVAAGSSSALAAPGASAPAASGLSATFQDCSEDAQGAVAQAACLAAEEERQDQRLNQAYRALQAALSGSRRAQLVEAQRAWLASRNLDNTLEAGLYDASQPGNLQTALNDVQRLRARADQLQMYLQLID